MDEGFRTFEHTGDVGLEVWAETPERLYALAVEALLAQVIEAAGQPVDLEIRLSLTADNPGELLVDWLSVALTEAEVRRAVWTRASVQRLTPTSLEGTLAGPRRDRSRQVALREVKAVSYHGLELDLSPPNCRCRVILDI